MQKPLVWTLHDMWPLTGDCHYAMDCEGYQSICGPCPLMKFPYRYDLSRWIWKWKFRAWHNLPITFICPSNWMADNVRSSSLFNNLRVEVIANGLDLQLFFPGNRALARKRLGLPVNKSLVLFSAMRASHNPFKGFLFIEALIAQLIGLGWEDRLELVILGSFTNQNQHHFRIPVHFLGHLKDDFSLSLVYNAVDVLLAPSIIDNLPNTITEALACGTPCVAFDVGGIKDQVKTEINGYLANPFHAEEMAYGIHKVIMDSNNWQRLSRNARQTAENHFDIKKQVKRISDIYQTLIDS